MLRIAIIALSATLAVVPALAETASQSTAAASSSQQGPAHPSLLLDDGTSAMAQDNGQRNDGRRDDMWIGIGMFAIPAAILIALGIQSQNKKHVVSP